MSARVLVIGLDAASEALLCTWTQQGVLPAFARLSKEGVTAPLGSSLTTLPGAIWPELQSGRSAGRQGHFFHPFQFRTGEERARPIRADEIDTDAYFWSVASRAGRRVAVVDVPQTVPARDLNGIQVLEWSTHDQQYPLASDPPELLDELRRRHGEPRAEECDRVFGGHAKLLEALTQSVRQKKEMVLDLLGRESWDLFTCVFGESHCVGHHFWHFHDATHRRHDPGAAQGLRLAIQSVYRELDAAIARLVEAAGPSATVIVVASHGMGPYLGGPGLLPDVLARLGVGRGRPLRLRLGPWVPEWARKVVRRATRARIPDQQKLGFDDRHARIGGPGIRAFPMFNNRCGAIRLNLVGREPEGCVRPGAEADALLEELQREILALRDPVSGEPIVENVVSAEETFGPVHHRDLPDLMVAFRSDLGPLEACESPRVGQVRKPIRASFMRRTGDHVPGSRLWAAGPGVPAGLEIRGAHVLDVAPTVLRLLDVEPPCEMDGRPLSFDFTPRRG